MRVAAVDCGTNATRLLVADVTSAGIQEVTRRLTITRMGQLVDVAGVIGEDALRRVEGALRSYAQLCRELSVESIGVLATSAARDARNATDLVDLVERTMGVRPVVLSGHEEAIATHGGALTGLAVTAPALVVDLGGGSTEFAVAHNGGVSALSVNIGSVRLTERTLRDDPPYPRQVAAAVAEIDEAIVDVPGLGHRASLVAVGGTALTLAALQLGFDDPDDRGLHGARVTRPQVDQLAEDLVFTPSRCIATLTPVTPGREDVIGAGALILSRVLALTDMAEMIVSRHDLLDDLARALGGQAGAGGGPTGPGPRGERGLA